MKKILLILSFLIISCGKNKEEQMFYDFMDDAFIKLINVSVKDMDLEIIKLKKVGEIKASDSIDVLISYLTDLKNTLEEDKISIDKSIKDKEKVELKKSKTTHLELQSGYQKSIDLYQELIDKKREYSSKRQLSFEKTSARLKELKLNPNQVISTKYELRYSIYMPDTKITNTFKGFAYTNSDNSKFISTEE